MTYSYELVQQKSVAHFRKSQVKKFDLNEKIWFFYLKMKSWFSQPCLWHLSKSAPYINPLPSCNCYLLTYLLTGLSSCNRDLPTHRPCKLQLRLTYLQAWQAATETYLLTGLASCNRDLTTYRPGKLQPRLTYLQALQAATETYLLTGLASCNRDLPTHRPCKLQPNGVIWTSQQHQLQLAAVISVVVGAAATTTTSIIKRLTLL